ncbi:MAG: hypothetical protein IJR08_02500 [Bacilli bacterium]|nr:hypothetical protein [Bacilli bacterium]
MNNYCVDVNGEYIKAKSKIFRSSLLFSLILTAVIIADVLLVALAGEEYIVNFIISSIITVLFIWFMIFFISNVYSDINARYQYFRGYQSGIQPTDEVIFIRKSDELCYVNGLYVYPVFVRYLSTLGERDKIIYTLDDLNYQEEDKLTITTYQRIIIKAEKHA